MASVDSNVRVRLRDRVRLVRDRIKMIWLMVGVAFAFYAIIESTFYLANKVAFRPVPVIDVDFMSTADTYGGAPWARQVCEASEAVRNHWEPQVYFAPKPVASDVFNIDEHGWRRTTNAAVAPVDSSAVKIALFGGSTLFGYGSRDDYTIPSALARQLREQHNNVSVSNFGRIGYVSNQEVLLLFNELKAGRVPDIVIFYDGVNDVETAMLGLKAGVAYSETRLAQQVESNDESARGALKKLFSRSPMVRFFIRINRRRHNSDVADRLRAADTDQLAHDVADVYCRNIAFVRNLGKVYGFDCRFYWQPTLYQKQPLTPFEQSIFDRPWYEGLPLTGCPEYKSFYAKAYQAVRQAALPDGDFRDISDLFAHDPAPRYFDPQHIAESGNEIVARTMLSDIEWLINKRGRQRN